MGTRYGRRASDGTVEYHDSKDALLEAEAREKNEAITGCFGFFGLIIGGVLTYFAFVKFGGMDFPKWFRFSSILVGAFSGAFVFAKFAYVLWAIIVMAIGAFVVLGVGAVIWHSI